MKFNVAIDGPSGAGKSVIALLIAKKYNLLHINSGSMYRALAYKVLQEGIDPFDVDKITNQIDLLDLKLTHDQKVFLDKKEITTDIRNEKISKLASDISKFPSVREKLVLLQQKMASQKNCIMEGRDITSVVLPDAEIKIYLTADVDVRAQRRTKDLLEKGFEADFNQIKTDIVIRDEQDMNREVAPLKIVADALIVDSTHLTIEQTCETIYLLIDNRLKEMSND